MSPSEKEHLSEEIRMRVGSVLSTLYAVSVISTKQSDQARKLEAEERQLLDAHEELKPGTMEYAAYYMRLNHIRLRRQKLMRSSESLASIDSLIPMWDLRQTVEIDRLKARRDALT
jgi:hypothetical protein